MSLSPKYLVRGRGKCKKGSDVQENSIGHVQRQQIRMAYSTKTVLAHIPRTLKGILVGDTGRRQGLEQRRTAIRKSDIVLLFKRLMSNTQRSKGLL